MKPFRLKWIGSWRDTTAENRYGAKLRVRFLPGSRSWGVYVDDDLRHKVAVGVSDTRRARAKVIASSWYGSARPAGSVACAHCHGTGRVGAPQ